jgi:DNA invertase Pin-like site-specific DNA recombinase
MMFDKDTPQAPAPRNRTGKVERTCAAGYVRVAAVTQTNPQRDLRAQRAQVRAKAKAEGLRLVGIIEDAGASAHDLHRPGLARLFTLLDDATIKAVIVLDLARLARDPNHLQRLLSRFAANGVVLITIDGL